MRGRSRHPEETAIRMGAIRLGIDPHQYRAQVELGRKWCSYHKTWEPRGNFGPHILRSDGLNTACQDGIRATARETMRRLRARRAAGAWP